MTPHRRFIIFIIVLVVLSPVLRYCFDTEESFYLTIVYVLIVGSAYCLLNTTPNNHEISCKFLKVVQGRYQRLVDWLNTKEIFRKIIAALSYIHHRTNINIFVFILLLSVAIYICPKFSGVFLSSLNQIMSFLSSVPKLFAIELSITLIYLLITVNFLTRLLSDFLIGYYGSFLGLRGDSSLFLP